MGIITDIVSTVFFIMFLSIALLAIISSILFLFRAYYGYSYLYIPHLNKIKDFENRLVIHYSSEGYDEEQVNELVEADFQDYLVEIYVEVTTENMKLNQRKLWFLYKCGWSLVIILSAELLAYLLYFIGQRI